MSDIDYPTYTLDKFNVLGIKGNIKGVKVDVIREIVYKTGDRAGTPFKCSIGLSDNTASIWIGIWQIESDLPFKVGDTISISQVASDYNKHFEKWQIKKCKASIILNHSGGKAVGDALKIADSVSSDPSDPPYPFEEKTETVMMPFNPNAIESAFTFYPELDHPQLRKLHSEEKMGAIRGHIENLIVAIQTRDAVIENTKATIRVGDLLEAMMKK